MADLDKTKFNLGYLIKGEGIKDWWKAWGSGIKLVLTIVILGLLILGGMNLWNWFFPKKPVQNNSQDVAVHSGGIANITNNYVQKNDAGWEVGVFGGGLTLGSQQGVFVGGEVKRRF